MSPTIPRRSFLADSGMGFASLVLGAMLHRDGIVRAERRRPTSCPTVYLTSRPKPGA